jgi:hypothetical protein
MWPSSGPGLSAQLLIVQKLRWLVEKENMRTLQDEIEIIEMCQPIRDNQGGMWFGHNHNFADATFVDYGACRAFATAARSLSGLVKALEAAKEFADDEFSDCNDLNRKNRISALCDKIDAALALTTGYQKDST